MPPRAIAYWVLTGLFCLLYAASGGGYLLQAQPFAEGMAHLGYPPYLLPILGTAKLSAAAVLIAPGLPLLKEWAFAGVNINLAGATASHVFAGDPAGDILAPVFVLALAWSGYLLRPAARRLPQSPTLAADAADAADPAV